MHCIGFQILLTCSKVRCIYCFSTYFSESRIFARFFLNWSLIGVLPLLLYKWTWGLKESWMYSISQILRHLIWAHFYLTGQRVSDPFFTIEVMMIIYGHTDGAKSLIANIIDCCLYLMVIWGLYKFSLLLCTFWVHSGLIRLFFDFFLTCGSMNGGT